MSAADAPPIATIRVGINNLYAIKTPEGAILIDAGPDYGDSWSQLVAALRDAGIELEDVRYVLITHFHSDHAGFGRRWQELGAGVLAGQGDAWHLRMGPASFPQEVDVLWAYMQENGVPDDITVSMAERILRASEFNEPASPSAHPEPVEGPEPAEGTEAGTPETRDGDWYPTQLRMAPVVIDRPLFDRDPIELGGVRVEAIATPGHTPGSTCFFEPESGTLFTGDHIIPGIFSNPSLYFEENNPKRRLRAMPDYMRSLEKLRHLPVRTIAPGHKEPASDLPGLIDRIVHHTRRRTERFARSLESRPQTLFELAERNYPPLLRRDLWYVMAEVTGHVDLLEDAGRAAREFDGAVWRVRGTG